MDEELQEVYDALMVVMKKDDETGNSFYPVDCDSLWFTTKLDPTPEEASSYYELDEYGDPVDKEGIAKEVLAYIGDGAITLREAIGCWIDEALHKNRIYWKSALRTEFNEKPIVDGIEASETKLELEESKKNFDKLEEAVMTWDETITYGLSDPGDFFKRLSNVIDSKKLKEILEKSLLQACDEGSLQNIQKQFSDIKAEDVKGNKTITSNETDNSENVEQEDTDVVSQEQYDKVEQEFFEAIGKYAYLDVDDVKNKGYQYLKQNISNKYIPEYIAKTHNKLYPDKFVKTSDVTEKNLPTLCRDVIGKLAEDEAKAKKNKKESKQFVSNILKLTNKEVKTESAKTRLKEENSKSLNLISQMFQDKDFDSESKAGQIVIRTSELFNALSDKGYDVQVTFDNGESTNTILLGQQGGQVVITITDTNTPLRAFAGGNFEVTDDNINELTDIQEQISSL